MRILAAIVVGLVGCGNVDAAKTQVDAGGSVGGESVVVAAGGAAGDRMTAAGGAAGSGSAGAVWTNGGAAAGDGGTGGPSAPNLITNGDFLDGTAGAWIVTADGAASSGSVTVNGEFCVTLPSAVSLLAIGWPDSSTPPAALLGGSTYQFSFGVRTNVRMDATMFENKVGEVGPPYTPDLDVHDALAPGSPTVVTHTFTVGQDDLTAGVVFLLHGPPAGTTFCVDRVALRQAP